MKTNKIIKPSGFSMLFELMQSKHKAEIKKAKKIFRAFGSSNQEKFIEWVNTMECSEFENIPIEHSKETVNHLLSLAD